jgi:Sulfotransferase family
MSEQATAPALSYPNRDLDGGPPIFVGGIPRNGTTLTARLLGSHSEIALPPAELGFFDKTWRPGDDPWRPMEGRAELERRLTTLVDRNVLEWGLTRDEVFAAARTLRPTHRDLFVFLLDLYRRHVDKDRLAEKSINYQRWLYVLDAWFEDYRFVHVIRHPVDAFASLRWFERGLPVPVRIDLVPWIHEWNRSATLALNRSHARPDRYCYVRYEDLVERPVDVLERVCKTVGVTPEPERMLEMAGFESPDNSSFGSDSARYDGRIRRDAVDRTQRIDPRDLEAIRSACAPLAYLLGYEGLEPPRTGRGRLGQPVPGKLPRKVAAAFLAKRIHERARRLVRRLGKNA